MSVAIALLLILLYLIYVLWHCHGKYRSGVWEPRKTNVRERSIVSRRPSVVSENGYIGKGYRSPARSHKDVDAEKGEPAKIRPNTVSRVFPLSSVDEMRDLVTAVMQSAGSVSRISVIDIRVENAILKDVACMRINLDFTVHEEFNSQLCLVEMSQLLEREILDFWSGRPTDFVWPVSKVRYKRRLTAPRLWALPKPSPLA
jgi:hypothetical protein